MSISCNKIRKKGKKHIVYTRQRNLFVFGSGIWYAVLILWLIILPTRDANAQNGSVTKGHELLLKYGLQIQALSSPWQSGFLDSSGIDTWEDSYFTTVSCNAHPNYSYQTSHTNTVPWDAMSYAEGGVYSMSSMGIPAALKETLVGIQIGDEQSIAVPIPQAMIDAFATERAAFPTTMIYGNNNPLYNLNSSGVHKPITLSMLGTYMSAVNPDMLCFTEYAMCFQGTGYVYDYEGGSPTMMYEDLELYRDAGLAGVDGTGTNPIPVGCYIQNFIWDHPHTNRRIMSGSEVRLAQFAPWTFGCKAVKAFIYGDHTAIEEQYQVMFEHDTEGNCDYDKPKEQYYVVAETNRQSGNLGDSLVRLINYGVYMKLGLHEDSSEEVVSNSLPSGVSEWTYGCGADPYITNITVANLGTKNNGHPGDVILGLFKPLDASLVEPGLEEDTYFMVTNGLTDATGTAVDCSLRIRIDFDFQSSGITRLLRKSRDTGEVEVVNLTPHLYPGQYYLLFDLDGGTGDLFKFDNGATFITEPSTPEVHYTFKETAPGTWEVLVDLTGATAGLSAYEIWVNGVEPSDISYAENTLGTSIDGFMSSTLLQGDVDGNFNAGNYQNYESAIENIGKYDVNETDGTIVVDLDAQALLGILTTPAGLTEENFRVGLVGLLNELGTGYFDANYLVATFDVIKLLLLPGDANGDGVVSAGDYASVQANFGVTGAPGILGDANGDGVVSAGDYASVQANFGNTAAGVVAEPATLMIFGICMITMVIRKKSIV